MTVLIDPAWDSELVTKFRRLVARFPELDGPLARQVKGSRGAGEPATPTHAVFESHLNITEATAACARALLLLGFEPDDFAEPFPRQYRRHYTLKLTAPRSGLRRAQLARWLTDQTSAAEAIVHRFAPHTEWYLEREVYPSGNARTYACRTGDLPTTTARTGLRTVVHQEGGVPDAVHKRADIHVKLCRRCAGDAPDHSRHAANEIGDLLSSLHFYRVVTGAGNVLYTGQFVSRRQARTLFIALDRLAGDAGQGIAGITLESCVGFTRSFSRAGLPADAGPILALAKPT